MLYGIIRKSGVQCLINRPRGIVIDRKSIFGSEPFSSLRIDGDVTARVVGQRRIEPVETLKGRLSSRIVFADEKAHGNAKLEKERGSHDAGDG